MFEKAAAFVKVIFFVIVASIVLSVAIAAYLFRGPK